MTVGIVMLVHTALDRAGQVARHWAAAGCPVVIHVDRNVDRDVFDRFAVSLAACKNVSFSDRYRCEWGTWGMVEATKAAAALMLRSHADVKHVYLASGACLPLRPVHELVDYLAERPRTDFIESATTSDVLWTVGGLDEERFKFRFPFAWKKHRVLFDRYVALQRRLGVQRKIPNGIVPHMGSQWWCLSRQTLSAILQDPHRSAYDAYFKRVWIPDESYFQTLARLYSTKIESRSLTLSKFDYQGKPHIFYDDHLQLLRRSDCFVARKIWPEANRLYDAFLGPSATIPNQQEPNPAKIDRVFSRAVDRRLRGRPGLYMQSRYPSKSWDAAGTAAHYWVFQGFTELFEDFEPWLTRSTSARVHGHLFARERAQFAENSSCIAGALTDSALIRDYNPASFLSNVIWNTRGEHQCFQFSPKDNQDVVWQMVKDPHAKISVISGAWAVPLFRSNADFIDLRQQAARLQKIENSFLQSLRSTVTKARFNIWTMAEFIESPMEPLQTILNDIDRDATGRLSEVPRMVDLSGFGKFLQNLKNQGMHPYLMGDFPVEPRTPDEKPRKATRPYLVR